MYYLFFDNGMGHFDCASKHDTLAGAIQAAGEGYQARQYITDGKNIVWKNY